MTILAVLRQYLGPASARSGAGLLLLSLLGATGVAAVRSPGAGAERVPYRDFPPPGFSGGFGEDSCQACHFSADLNQPPGTLSASGLPERYSPGETYRITLTLTRPGMALGGFQLTSRFADGGAQAGALSIDESETDRARVSASSEIQYAHHLEAGTKPVAADTARWTIAWTAPTDGGAVLLHVATNAADGDDSALGDYVYTGSWRSEPLGR